MLTGQLGIGVTRRRFLTYLGAGIASVAAMPIVSTLVPRVAQAARPWRAFHFDTRRDVDIFIHRSQNPRRLHITVRRGRELLDEFPRADPHTLDRLDCAHFSVRYTDPPEQ